MVAPLGERGDRTSVRRRYLPVTPPPPPLCTAAVGRERERGEDEADAPFILGIDSIRMRVSASMFQLSPAGGQQATTTDAKKRVSAYDRGRTKANAMTVIFCFVCSDRVRL